MDSYCFYVYVNSSQINEFLLHRCYDDFKSNESKKSISFLSSLYKILIYFKEYLFLPHLGCVVLKQLLCQCTAAIYSHSHFISTIIVNTDITMSFIQFNFAQKTSPNELAIQLSNIIYSIEC
jgi:hypothetical protein